MPNIKTAWQYREEGEPVKAIALWMNDLANYISQEDCTKVIDTLVDLHIAWKNLGKQTGEKIYLETSLSCLNQVKEISEKKGFKLRSDWHYYMGGIQLALENYGESIKNYENFLNTAKPRPEIVADVSAHIGYTKSKLGSSEEGVKLLRASIEVLKKSVTPNIHQEKDVNAIWLTGALLYLAEIIRDKSIAQEALGLASEKGLGARATQAKNLLKNLG